LFLRQVGSLRVGEIEIKHLEFFLQDYSLTFTPNNILIIGVRLNVFEKLEPIGVVPFAHSDARLLPVTSFFAGEIKKSERECLYN
jgi:hypothetical protein